LAFIFRAVATPSPPKGVDLEEPETSVAQERGEGFLASLLERLLSPVDIASLVFFRIFFGIVSFWHVWLQVPGVRGEYITPEFHFSHYGFEWVKPLPGELMNVVFLIMAASTIFIALGLYYRWAAAIFFLTHTYAFFIDQAGYWNHYYLICLLAFLMIFVPCHRAFSLDVLRGAEKQSDDAPAWSLWILRAQVGIAYFFAGLAKTGNDWLDGKPMDTYLRNHQDFPLIGRFFDDERMVYFMAYGGLMFDLLIVPLLLWKVTRWYAVAAAVGFHLANSLIFDIQIFPWLAIAGTLLFLAPEWPRLGNQWRRLSGQESLSPAVATTAQGANAEPASIDETPAPRAGEERSPRRLSLLQKGVIGVMAVFFLFQLLMPLRHYLYPTTPEWSSEGYFFAWRMLLADKEGRIQFHVKDTASGAVCRVDNAQYVAGFQNSKLEERPDMMVQFADILHETFRKERGMNVEVYAWSEIELNGRPYLQFVDPTVNLVERDRTLGHHSFIIPLEEAQQIQVPAVPRCAPRPNRAT
jgi:hypothetical protein